MGSGGIRHGGLLKIQGGGIIHLGVGVGVRLELGVTVGVGVGERLVGVPVGVGVLVGVGPEASVNVTWKSSNQTSLFPPTAMPTGSMRIVSAGTVITGVSSLVQLAQLRGSTLLGVQLTLR